MYLIQQHSNVSGKNPTGAGNEASNATEATSQTSETGFKSRTQLWGDVKWKRIKRETKARNGQEGEGIHK